MIEISHIHVMFPWLAYVIKVKDESESLRKKLIDAIINNLKGFKDKDHDEGLKTREESYEMLPKFTINTLENISTEFIRK